MRALALALLLLGTGVASAAEEQILHLGQPTSFTPGVVPARVVCDDLSVVRVEATETHFVLVGLKPGSTLCSFWPISTPGLSRQFRFVVVPE
jgi:hypothetical protein